MIGTGCDRAEGARPSACLGIKKITVWLMERVGLREPKWAEDNAQALSGPDLSLGVNPRRTCIKHGPLLAKFDGAALILIRQGESAIRDGRGLHTVRLRSPGEGLVLGPDDHVSGCYHGGADFEPWYGPSRRSSGAHPPVLLNVLFVTRHGYGQRKKAGGTFPLSRCLQLNPSSGSFIGWGGGKEPRSQAPLWLAGADIAACKGSPCGARSRLAG